MKIGFIGGGNMGGAIIGGIVDNKIANSGEVTVSDTNKESLELLSAKYKVVQATGNAELARAAEILFLCVKPQVLYTVIEEIRGFVTEDTLIVSIVAGQSIEAIEDAFGGSIKLVRVMPNTPALVGEGMAAVTPNKNVTDAELTEVARIFNALGKCEIVSESMMDAVTAVSGSSPAYVFMFIEAMADAAVMCGMSRKQAYTFAAQSVLGSAKMVLEKDMHPALLKDMVCSPAGTTIDAVAVLEQKGFRSAVIEAMRACADKSKELGKK